MDPVTAQAIAELVTFKESIQRELVERYGCGPGEADKMIERSHWLMSISASPLTAKAVDFYVGEIARLEDLKLQS